MPFSTLIDTSTLAHHLDDPSFALLDCRFRLDDPGWGLVQYKTVHIPGAVFLDLDRDLSGSKTGTNGRHPLPDPSEFARTLGRLGIDQSMQVVAYDQDISIFASRVWWMLRWLGHGSVAVLDGGFAKWEAEGRAVRAAHEIKPARIFQGTPRRELIADAREIAGKLHHPDVRLLDARSPERFRGENETLDKKAGHIPGAVNHYYTGNLNGDNTFKPPDELRRDFEQTLAEVPATHAISYCGSGVTACHNLLAMERAGLAGARLYPGSWSEWSSDSTRPVEPPEK
jgi:thiosulfate/3-mercaptopyruvate sulfurtransferase